MRSESNKRLIAVIGGGKCDSSTARQAYEVGRLIAMSGYGLVNGGLGGVMEASAEGCLSVGGLTVALLPGSAAEEANEFMKIIIPTGLGSMRNEMIVRASEALIAIGGEYGTLSEIALGLKAGKAVIGLGSWDIKGVKTAESPEEALLMAIKAIDADNISA